MNKLIIGFVLLCCYGTSLSALSVTDPIDSFEIHEHLEQNVLGFKLVSKDSQIGALKPVPNTSGTFEFIDAAGIPQILFKFVAMDTYNPREEFNKYLRSYGMRGKKYCFNVYNKDNRLIAKLNMLSDIGLVSFLRFVLVSPDEKTILMQGGSNLLSMETQHTFYLGESSKLFATSSRALWTLQRNSKVTLLNKNEFYKHDANMLAAVLTFYCLHDIEFSVDN